ncbi:MAG: hypothetical protein OEW15_03955 [Nitrospirota bacterium]|nr:hypothetical protein [Nitrospirota bacterium]
MKRMLIFLLMLLTLSLLAACGGGGGGGATAPVVEPTQAFVKISTSGTLPSGTLVGGVDVTVTLPSGVTVASTTPPQTDAGVVAGSGLAGSSASAMGTYGSSENAVRVLLADPDGMAAGEFATVTCAIASGSSPSASDFTVSSATVKDLNGAAISGMTATLSVTMQ